VISEYAKRVKNTLKQVNFEKCLMTLKGQYFEKNLMGDYLLALEEKPITLFF
jgi:hypothetical protein